MSILPHNQKNPEDRGAATSHPCLRDPFKFREVDISMRELQAVQTIFAKALMRARESSKHIQSLQLAIGELSELDRESIRKYWAELSRGSPAERAQLRFRSVKAEVQCMACFMKYHPSDGKIHCPYCGSYGAKILSGEEFYLESIEWVDE